MTQQEFILSLSDLFDNITKKFQTKSKEYASDYSVFENFDKGSKITGLPPELVLDGYLLKHYVSYRDILDEIYEGRYPELLNHALNHAIMCRIDEKNVDEVYEYLNDDYNV